MTWVETTDDGRRDALVEVHDLAEWSDWAPFEAARLHAPREPGVYLLREPGSGAVRYVGMAGERAGGGRPQGLHGRLSAYLTGKEKVSGFGEAALDLALADPEWVEQRLRALREHGPRPTRDWVRGAVERLGLEVSWAVTADRGDAVYLEDEVVRLLRPYDLWRR
jgi:hypothetical protein